MCDICTDSRNDFLSRRRKYWLLHEYIILVIYYVLYYDEHLYNIHVHKIVVTKYIFISANVIYFN